MDHCDNIKHNAVEMDNKECQIQFLLQVYGKGQQRTAEWFTTRKQRITASECYKAMSTASFSARRDLMLDKLQVKLGNSTSPAACVWGTEFEPIAKKIYMQQENVDIVDLDCVIHPEFTFLGASPDGLILTNDERRGRLIELKCPYTRDFDENSDVPIEYYHQMQMQLACTCMDECVYLETKFTKPGYAAWTSSTKTKSAYAVRGSEVLYCDSYVSDDVEEWTSKLPDRLTWEVHYWVLEKTRCKLIKKDLEWMSSHIGEFKSTWDEIMEHSKNGTLPGEKKVILAL